MFFENANQLFIFQSFFCSSKIVFLQILQFVSIIYKRLCLDLVLIRGYNCGSLKLFYVSSSSRKVIIFYRVCVCSRLIIGSDTFNKRKVDCDRLLVRTSPYQEEVERMSAMPCPYGERCNYGKKCKYLHQQQQESRGARARRLNRTLGSKTR